MWATKRADLPQQPEYNTACNPEAVGPNTIFLSLAPVVVSLAVQVYDIRPALIAGTALAGFVVALGFLLYIINARRVPLYLLDSVILISLLVQLGVCYPNKYDVARCFNFILFASLTGLSVVSLLVGYPFCLQHVREGVPRQAWRHPRVMQAGLMTTIICVATFTINTMIYLVPVAQDVWWDPQDGLTIAFQVVIPIILYAITLLIIRLAPGAISHVVTDSDGFNVVTHNPLAHTV